MSQQFPPVFLSIRHSHTPRAEGQEFWGHFYPFIFRFFEGSFTSLLWLFWGVFLPLYFRFLGVYFHFFGGICFYFCFFGGIISLFKGYFYLFISIFWG